MKAFLVTMAALIALAPGATWAAEAPAPPNPVTVQLASGSETLYPFTTYRFPAPPTTEKDDPVNLIFEGAADPREIRAALMSLDGDRTMFQLPDEAPFNCTWHDSVGDEQATWTAGAGWEGAAIQLACGDYNFRFHVRLFRHGARTLGGTHADIQTPGTTDHNVASWDFPQRLVMLDMIRSGLLASDPYLTDVFGATPTHRGLPYYIHNALPVGLRVLFGLPPGPVPVGASAPINCNGRAAVLTVRPSFVPAQSDARTELIIPFHQVIPKPFCDTTGEFLFVDGPVTFVTRVQINPSGKYLRTELVSGLLSVTPVDPATGQPTGPTVQAVAAETHRGMLTDEFQEVSWVASQTLYGEVAQMIASSFAAGQHDSYSAVRDCGPTAP